jgi:hypothetical protein
VEPPPDCSARPFSEQVGDAVFDVGPPRRSVCHRLGEVRRCWSGASLREPAAWDITAPLDDLLGPDGATTDADPFFRRAFRGHPAMQDHWETDDDTFYAWPGSRAEAVRMAAIVDRVLRAGPFHRKR